MTLPHELPPGADGISDEARAAYGDDLIEALNRPMVFGKPIIHVGADQLEQDQLREVVRKMYPHNKVTPIEGGGMSVTRGGFTAEVPKASDPEERTVDREAAD